MINKASCCYCSFVYTLRFKYIEFGGRHLELSTSGLTRLGSALSTLFSFDTLCPKTSL
jgi:hypothetical protein